MDTHESAMQKAIELSKKSMESGGGPFGAVVVWHGQIVGTGMNRVVPDSDPTAHAEMNAIREASRRIGSFDLSDCVLFTSCEPCLMCLGAVYWSRIKEVYFGAARSDAAVIGFDDKHIYQEMNRDLLDRSIPFHRYLEAEALAVFRAWENDPERRMY